MKKLFFLLTLAIPLSMAAQKKGAFRIEVSSDTVGLDGYIQVTFTVENEKVKKFTPPNFDGFEVQGPSTSSMMSIVNGESSQSMSYTYMLTPRETGALKIGAAQLTTDSGILSTDEKEVIAIEHYDAHVKKNKQRRNFFDDDSDDFFRPRIKPRVQPEPDKSKSKYPTEKI